jgi:hypothetical protein
VGPSGRYRRVVDVVFAKVREMADADMASMGSSDPKSLLHVLDKWLWWAGGRETRDRRGRGQPCVGASATWPTGRV